ncbi:MAG: Peptide chain release factor RF1 [Chlamydiia bacterium]|nr:Peptide chain release factor RF1 [Chlamydiia bacterium]MCH9615953.1 Peptide chain release factor RF1 [Chlamydiia bacterium]MCH9628644.1 Peptide chain release factor RF1 [Chlamydiia bacterium]
MLEKVKRLLARLVEVEKELSDPQTVSDQEKFRKLTQDHSYLSDLKNAWEAYTSSEKALKENLELKQSESDPEFLQVIDEEITVLEDATPKLKAKVETLLVPPDPRDNLNAIVEIRAGTGGDEAAIFVGDVVRMYHLFADDMKWTIERLSATSSDSGGFKEYVMVISGKNVFRFMQYEAGTHRVQRIPTTETQGRVHTSAITVAVLTEPDESTPISLDEKDLKIDTYRASGAGGQHVNTTDSAVRITHLPTGTVCYCSEERSQHKNKDKAMRLLVAKIAEEEERKLAKERADARSAQVGSGDRSERIRTYNFPQNRITDHRIDLTLYKLDKVMEGDLADFSEALVAHYYQQQLSSDDESN